KPARASVRFDRQPPTLVETRQPALNKHQLVQGVAGPKNSLISTDKYPVSGSEWWILCQHQFLPARELVIPLQLGVIYRSG
ncbi:hypothetical protein LW967_17405, partial [Erwinia amylovora]|uniref:hypothetical protein n=1 Tax=Erwinia amylovora TaxID=552 RepID=UPI0020BEA4A0